MSTRSLQWLLLAAALLFVVVLETVRGVVSARITDTAGAALLSIGYVLVLMLFLAFGLSVVLRRHQAMRSRQQELLALYEASQHLHDGHRSLPAVLERVVEQARQLLHARYGAVSVVGDDQQIRQFVTSGVSEEVRARIGHPPRGEGLLGVVLHEGQRLRLKDLSADTRSAGFPAHHPPMKSLLAVPIMCNGPFRGNLYLAEKENAVSFSAEDEEVLVRFARTAASAIDNAYLLELSNALAINEERLRIAREMHDGMAQVLAYVNTKAQAVKEFLRGGRPEQAAAQLDQLATASREVYADIREGILSLRTGAPGRPLGDSLAEFVERWQAQSQITAELTAPERLPLPPTAELQLLRILQEALSNVRKHASASHARVTLEVLDGSVLARVEDDGSGFDPQAPRRREFPRFGLAVMRERAESIGGTLHVDSSPGRGTRVEVMLPIPENEPLTRERARMTS